MLIDLQEIQESSKEFDIMVEPSSVDLNRRFSTLKVPSAFHVRVRKKEWMAFVEGQADVLLERKCGRCLTKSEISSSVSFSCAYIKYEDISKEREIELDVEGVEYSVTDSDVLDLNEVFEEHLLVSLPDSFVCSVECAGLCPACGQNLNKAKCDCREKAIDPRWAALKKIKKDLD